MEKVVLFVDVQNVYYTTKQAFGRNFDYNEILATGNPQIVKSLKPLPMRLIVVMQNKKNFRIYFAPSVLKSNSNRLFNDPMELPKATGMLASP